MPRTASYAARAHLAALLFAAPLAAQQPITLEQAIAMAQQHSHPAAAARSTRSAARQRSDAFYAGLLPQLSLSGVLPNYNRSIVQVTQPDGSVLFRPQDQTSTSLNMVLTQRIPVTGGSFFVSSSLSRLGVGIGGGPSTQSWSSTPYLIGLRQDILKPNTTGWDRREQSVRSVRDEQAFLESMEDVALQTTDLFFGAYAAKVALDNANNNAAVNDTLYRLNQGRFQVGRIGENDLLQSQLALLRSRASADAARLEFERATAALRLGLGMAPDEPLTVAMSLLLPEFDVDTARAVAEALKNRAAVSDAQLQRVQADRRVTESRLGNGVGATVTASYGSNQTAPRADLAYRDLREARQFAVSVQMPLWQWGARSSSIHAAQDDRDRARTLSEQTMEQVAFDARFAALQIAQARSNVAVLSVADTVAGRRYDVAYQRYVIGRITVDNLYIAQNEKDQAVAQIVNGLRSYWEAYYRLRRATLYDFQQGRPIR